MVDPGAAARADAIKGFAAVLRELRDSAGTPSFREMSGRSRAISHTTLHEAAQGHRFPSWASTVEFVKACGADPADFRERWEQANRRVRVASGPSSNTGEPAESTGEPAESAGEPDAEDIAAESAAGFAPPRRRRHVLIGVAAAVVLALGAVVVGVATSVGDGPDPKDAPGSGHLAGRSADRSSRSSSAAQQPGRADCPVHQENPPPAPPTHRGDMSAFIADITLPDCTRVKRGETRVKVWRLKNVGRVTWRGYSLHRVDLPQRRDQCQTITDVSVAYTAPGKLVDIKVAVTAPNTSGFCFVRFKMQDAAGELAFPGSRPVNLQLIVD